MKYYHLPLIATLCLLASCTAKVPGHYTEVDKTPDIYPNYKSITIPYNIAPLNFAYTMEGEAFVTELQGDGQTLVTKGKEARWDIKEWHQFIEANKGKKIKINTYAKTAEGWVKYRTVMWTVAEEAIDPYISYRIIAPSYVTYEELSIRQRNLANFDESMIYNNMLQCTDEDGQCINCHSYKNYKTDNMQFHVRQHLGGTVFVHDGELKKVNLKTDSTMSAGVYPFFNPKYDVVAYSVNNTGQVFHTKNPNKVEVQDQASDVIIYDPVREVVAHVAKDPVCLEVFPAWSPDGEMLYYCSAYFPKRADMPHVENMIRNYKDIKYDILRRPWNPETGEFGAVDTVFAASAMGKSATFPRVSPCGRYLLFALAEYGCFHIWHKDADLYVLELATGECHSLEKANSDFPESYHSWSSTGKWILFASRRDDTNYSRLYIAHMNDDGTSDKAFLLPQAESEFYDFFDRSYNVPEFMVEPVRFTPHEFLEVVKGEAVNVKYSTEFR